MILLPILTTSLIHLTFLTLRGWESVLFELGSGRVKKAGNTDFEMENVSHLNGFVCNQVRTASTSCTRAKRRQESTSSILMTTTRSQSSATRKPMAAVGS